MFERYILTSDYMYDNTVIFLVSTNPQYRNIKILSIFLFYTFQLIEMSQEKLNSFKVKKLSPPPMNYILYIRVSVLYGTQ